jgi:hypothetical protein
LLAIISTSGGDVPLKGQSHTQSRFAAVALEA